MPVRDFENDLQASPVRSAERSEREERFWEAVQAIRDDMRGLGHLNLAIPAYDGRPGPIFGKLLRRLQTPKPIAIKVGEVTPGEDVVKLVSGIALPTHSPTARWGKNPAHLQSLAEMPVGVTGADEEAFALLSQHVNLTSVRSTTHPGRKMEEDFPDSYLTYPFLRDGTGNLTALKTGGRYYYNGRLEVHHNEPGFISRPIYEVDVEYEPWEMDPVDVREPYDLDPELPATRHAELIQQGLQQEIAELWAAAADPALNADHSQGVREYLARLRATATPQQEPWLALIDTE
jgi:hypothetical protein